MIGTQAPIPNQIEATTLNKKITIATGRLKGFWNLLILSMNGTVIKPAGTAAIDRTPNSLLGITVEGKSTFSIIDSWREKNNLCMAEVSFRSDDSTNAEPIEVGDEFQEYVELLKGLAVHPMVEDLNIEISFENLREIAWCLAELLPVSNKEKTTNTCQGGRSAVQISPNQYQPTLFHLF